MPTATVPLEPQDVELLRRVGAGLRERGEDGGRVVSLQRSAPDAGA